MAGEVKISFENNITQSQWDKNDNRLCNPGSQSFKYEERLK